MCIAVCIARQAGPTVNLLQGWPYDIYSFVEPPVAHAEGELNDFRAILGHDTAIDAYRKNKLPFPDGTIITRIAWRYGRSTSPLLATRHRA